MSQIIQVKKLRVLFTGSLHDYTRRDAQAALKLAGGQTCYGASGTFDAAVVGRRAGQKDLEVIASRNKPQLDEEQFKRLIQFGELDLDAADAPEAEVSAGESVGELRGILDGEPSPKKWRDIIAVLDQTAPERLTEVISYVEGYVSRWPLDETRRWHTSIVEAKLPESASWIAGDLRIAPKHWVEQLLAGEDSVKFSVVRALSLEGTKAKTSAASKLFASKHLSQLRHLDCGRDLKLTKTFFKKLGQSASMSNLETLIYYPYKKSGSGAELAASTHLTSLKHLKIRYADYGIDHNEAKKDLQELFSAPWSEQIESLESSMGGSPRVSCSSALMREDVLGAYGERFTGLKRMDLADYVSAQSIDPFKEVFGRVEVLGVTARAYYHSQYPTWHSAFNLFDGMVSLGDIALHTLDISKLMIFEGDRVASSQKKMIQEFVKHPIVKQIEHIVVNEFATKETLDALAKLDGVKVTVSLQGARKRERVAISGRSCLMATSRANAF